MTMFQPWFIRVVQAVAVTLMVATLFYQGWIIQQLRECRPEGVILSGTTRGQRVW